VERAAEAVARRRAGAPIQVLDLDPERAEAREYAQVRELELRGELVGELRHGPPGRILRVS
jgi:hypothetical protein